MNYSVAHISLLSAAEWQCDVLPQVLGSIGFDAFEQDDTTLHAYIPTRLLQTIPDAAQSIAQAVAEYNGSLIHIEQCEQADWNATWEQEHPIEHLPLDVTITPRCAFGAGHHETTGMMITELLSTPLLSTTAPCPVLDMGTGTGVLAIMAAKRGAHPVIAADIDEQSITNAEENAQANHVQLSLVLTDHVPLGEYTLIMANIHRNILLAQMDDYATCLLHGGELWLSGFYEDDIPLLTQAAATHALTHIATRANNEWRMLIFRKE